MEPQELRDLTSAEKDEWLAIHAASLIVLWEQVRSMWEDGSWDKATVRAALKELESMRDKAE